MNILDKLFKVIEISPGVSDRPYFVWLHPTKKIFIEIDCIAGEMDYNSSENIYSEWYAGIKDFKNFGKDVDVECKQTFYYEEVSFKVLLTHACPETRAWAKEKLWESK